VVRYSAILILATTLSGCGWWNTKPDIEEVLVPVPVQVEVPEELQERYEIQEEVDFISPLDENAFVAMDKENVRSFQLMIINMLNKLRQWEAFYLEEE